MAFGPHDEQRIAVAVKLAERSPRNTINATPRRAVTDGGVRVVHVGAVWGAQWNQVGVAGQPMFSGASALDAPFTAPNWLAYVVGEPIYQGAPALWVAKANGAKCWAPDLLTIPTPFWGASGADPTGVVWDGKVNSAGFYPGVICRDQPNIAIGTDSVFAGAGTATCWVQGANGEELGDGFYLCEVAGEFRDGVLVFRPCASGANLITGVGRAAIVETIYNADSGFVWNPILDGEYATAFFDAPGIPNVRFTAYSSGAPAFSNYDGPLWEPQSIGDYCWAPDIAGIDTPFWIDDGFGSPAFPENSPVTGSLYPTGYAPGYLDLAYSPWTAGAGIWIANCKLNGELVAGYRSKQIGVCTGQTSGGVPIYTIADIGDANGGGQQAGLVGIGDQIFPDGKRTLDKLDVTNATRCLSTIDVGGAAFDFATYPGYKAALKAVVIVDGAIAFGQNPATGATSFIATGPPIGDFTASLQMTAVDSGGLGLSANCNVSNGPTLPSFDIASIGGAPSPVFSIGGTQGATGTDAIGNVFQGGLCMNVVSGAIDGGTY